MNGYGKDLLNRTKLAFSIMITYSMAEQAEIIFSEKYGYYDSHIKFYVMAYTINIKPYI